jgi:hypothetical protein
MRLCLPWEFAIGARHDDEARAMPFVGELAIRYIHLSHFELRCTIKRQVPALQRN